MPRIPFATYAPDISDNESATSKNILNCLPQGDGYGPFPGTVAGQALPGQCRGMFTATNPDGTLQHFAATNNKLYALTSGTWTDWSNQTGAVATVTIDVAGTGGTSGVYNSVPLTGGTGSGVQGNITVTGGGVTTITVDSTALGTGYEIYDSLTAASSNIGNTTGFAGEVATLTSTGLVTTTYTGIGQTDQWQFAQFNNTVLATQVNATLQGVQLPITTNHFSNVPGSPPQSRFVSVVNSFVMLSGISGHGSRIQWSDLDNFKQWTPGVGQSDFQDIPDGGNALKIAGFDLYGVVFQDRAARLLTYIGGNIVFQITKIAGGEGAGLFAPYAVAVGSDQVFWLSNQGFRSLLPGQSPQPIGKERVDRTFFSFVQSQSGLTLQLQNVIAVTDPQENRVYFTWPAGNDVQQFDAIFCYDWVLDKWAKINQQMEFLGNAPSTYRQNKIVLAASDLTHKIQNYENNSNPLEAQMETAEQGTDGRRLFVRGFRAVSDAQSVYGSISYRDETYSLATGSVAGLTIATRGSSGTGGNYLNVPLVGGSGTGATVNVNISGGIEGAVIISTGGTGYGLTSVRGVTLANAGSTGATTGVYAGIPLNGGTGSGAIATIPIQASGATTGGMSITTRGTGYMFNDSLTVLSSQVGGCTGIVFTVNNVADTTSLTLSTAVVGNAGSVLEISQLGPNYTAEAQPNPETGIIPFRKDTRYSRAKIRIPAGSVWNYARGIEPDGKESGKR